MQSVRPAVLRRKSVAPQPTPRPAAVLPDPTPNEVAALRRELATLRLDNVSLRSRTRTMEAALTAIRPRAHELPSPVVMGVYGQGTVVADLIADARTLEALGDVVAVRFIRCEQSGEIAGLELAALRPDGDALDAGFVFLARVAGMAVVD